MKVIINPDKELVAEIRKQLEEKQQKYGKRFCPCVLPHNHTADTVCMCKEFREQVDKGEPGECHCGLYRIIND